MTYIDVYIASLVRVMLDNKYCILHPMLPHSLYNWLALSIAAFSL